MQEIPTKDGYAGYAEDAAVQESEKGNDKVTQFASPVLCLSQFCGLLKSVALHN